jgi:hypothetical protein
MYCIEEGSTSDGLCADESHAHLLQILCQRHSKLGPLTEPDKKEVIFRIGTFRNSPAASTDFQILFRMLLLPTSRKRRVVIAEVRDLPLDAILEKPEFLFL